jgi:hypothetical protein
MCFFEQRPVGSGVARLAPTLDPGTAAVFNVRTAELLGNSFREFYCATLCCHFVCQVRLHNSTCKSFGVRLCMVDGEVRVRAVL